jgi:saccharopine dehydrogenase-like NADP-dependent oxidoreductase
MEILVLGGCGIQGRTVLHDLASDDQVSKVMCADTSFKALSRISAFTNMDKIQSIPLDASNLSELTAICKKADIVIDLLPKNFQNNVFEAALNARVSVVNTNYLHDRHPWDDRAKDAGISILPECGLDPGIDLVFYGDAMARFDEIHVIDSYCGGIPEKKACNNPLNYKLSWIWAGALSSNIRDSRIIQEYQIIDIPGMNQHDEQYVHPVHFPGLGTLEAFPNGDAVYFTDFLGVTKTVRKTGRYTLRWPGWSAFWRPMKQLGFLSGEPVNGMNISPFDFLDQFLGPQLQYADNEKDLVVMTNIFEGVKDRKKMRYTTSLLIERDLGTGILAMSKGVGYTASIVAKMIFRGDISKKGVLSPMTHIPVTQFLDSLKKRGIIIALDITEI